MYLNRKVRCVACALSHVLHFLHRHELTNHQPISRCIAMWAISQSARRLDSLDKQLSGGQEGIAHVGESGLMAAEHLTAGQRRSLNRPCVVTDEGYITEARESSSSRAGVTAPT